MQKAQCICLNTAIFRQNCKHSHLQEILVLGARDPGFNSWTSPIFCHTRSKESNKLQQPFLTVYSLLEVRAICKVMVGSICTIIIISENFVEENFHETKYN